MATANEQGMLNDAKQGCLDVSAAALAIFDYIERNGMRAMARTPFIGLLEEHQQARNRMFNALTVIGEHNLGIR